MAKAKTIDSHRVVEMKVVGTRPDSAPYIRLAYVDHGVEGANGYIGSLCNANSMRAFAKQILRALDGK